MKPTAIVTFDWDEDTRKHEPMMVLIFTPTRISAVGNPTTMAKDIADSILRRYQDIDPSKIEETLEFFLESYNNSSTSRGYSSESEVIPYEGEGKVKVDRIKDNLLSQRVNQTLQTIRENQ